VKRCSNCRERRRRGRKNLGTNREHVCGGSERNLGRRGAFFTTLPKSIESTVKAMASKFSVDLARVEESSFISLNGAASVSFS